MNPRGWPNQDEYHGSVVKYVYSISFKLRQTEWAHNYEYSTKKSLVDDLYDQAIVE